MVQPLQSLSVVIPAYNEATRLGRTLGTLATWLGTEVSDLEILVVDDGSTDDTAAVVRGFAESHPQVRLLQPGPNRGKGHAVKAGVLAATKAWVLFSDADLSTPIDELLELSQAAKSAAVVIGSRGLDASKILEHQPLYREWMGRGFNLLVQAAVLPGIHDTQCGFKLFRADAATQIFSRVTIDGFGFDVEALYLARRLGYTTIEVPVRWVNDRASKVSPVRDAARMAADLLRIRWRHRSVAVSAGARS